MDLKIFKLSIFVKTNNVMIQTRDYEFDNYRKALKFYYKKINEINSEFKTSFEFDYVLNDITNEEFC